MDDSLAKEIHEIVEATVHDVLGKHFAAHNEERARFEHLLLVLQEEIERVNERVTVLSNGLIEHLEGHT